LRGEKKKKKYTEQRWEVGKFNKREKDCGLLRLEKKIKRNKNVAVQKIQINSWEKPFERCRGGKKKKHYSPQKGRKTGVSYFEQWSGGT